MWHRQHGYVAREQRDSRAFQQCQVLKMSMHLQPQPLRLLQHHQQQRRSQSLRKEKQAMLGNLE